MDFVFESSLCLSLSVTMVADILCVDILNIKLYRT